MAKARASVLTAALCLAAAARGAETDPARRSLVVEAVAKASPAVVNISTEQVVERRGSPFPFPQDPFFEEFFRDFVDPRPRRFTTTSLGSGVIVDPDGTLLTNEHVVLRASRIHVTLADQREFDATVLGADADSDLTVLRIKTGDKLPHIALGSSEDLMIGPSGLAAQRVRPGSPVARIGVQKGDRVLGLGGAPLRSLAEFRRKIIELRGARNVLLSVGRGPYEYNVNVPLARG